MSEAETIDGEVVSVEAHEQHTLVPTGGTALAVTPQVQAGDLVERLAVIREAMQTAMEQDVDYGVIPGTAKPTLLKPGAEKLGVLFQLDVQLPRSEEVKTWGPGDHLTVEAHAIVYHAPTGARLGSGEGVCSTRESKYAKRKQERICPSCGTAAVIKGKEQYGGGWVCWKKRDGCGASFEDGDEAIEGQPTGEIDNPDLPDLWNTVTKMARKRARVDAVLAVTGASALFTQDVEDMQPSSPDAPAQASVQTPTGATVASDAQKGRIRRDFKKHRLTKGQARALLAKAGVVNVDDPDAAINGLAKHQASAVIDALEQGALPDPEQPSDIPSDGSEFVHQPSGDTSAVPIEDAE